MAFSNSLFYALIVALSAVHAVPVQGGLNLMRHDEYGPLSSDFATKYLEDHAGGVEQHNLDDIGGGHMFRQTRRGFDSSAGAFGEPRRFFPLRRMSTTLNGHPGNLDEIDRSSFDRFAKRNIDEIDRTAFDSFFKRNFDEIDRVGWDSFVKRLADYPSGKNRL